MTRLGYRLGDTISIPDRSGGTIRLKIKGFFDYWPSYNPWVTAWAATALC